MKKYLLCALAIFLLSAQTDKKSLLCHKWMQFASKSHDDQSPKMIDKSMAKECEFRADGSYQETMYNNQLKISGRWFFNADQTKFDFTMTEMNGQKLPESPGAENHVNKIIIKLTADTLIYGREEYYGKDGVYGHDDWYFAREK